MSGLKYACVLGPEIWYLDSAASWSLTNCSRTLFNFRHCSQEANITTPNKTELAIVGYGSLKLQFPESNHVLRVDDVALVPNASFNLISLGKLDRLGNEFKVGGGKITMLGTDLDFKLEGNTYCARAQRVSRDTSPTPRVMVSVAKQVLGGPHDMPHLSNAAVAPGAATPKIEDYNILRCTYHHAHADLLKATGKQLGITLTGSLKPCNACAQSKEIRKPIASSTSTRSNKKLGRVYCDMAGPRSITVRGKS